MGDDFDFDDWDDLWDILIPLLTNILIVVLVVFICIKCCKCRRNQGEILATPAAVVITSTQHYPAGPTLVASPTGVNSGGGYQQLQQPQQKPATAPPPMMATASQDPPSYDEAIRTGPQTPYNPHYGGQ